MKLNQVIALVTGRKAKAQRLLTEVYRGWVGERLSGISRVYQPLEEDGLKFPPESRIVQLRAGDELKRIQKQLNSFWVLVMTQEYANTEATGTIKVNGKILQENIPVSVLLFLEKQLLDLHTLATKLPILPTDRIWRFDENKKCFVTEAEQTTKTQKVQKPIVLYQATEQHPAQTQMITEDVIIGHWDTVHFSGALPVTEKDELIERIEKLQDAVKTAREEANGTDVVVKDDVSRKILDFVFTKEQTPE